MTIKSQYRIASGKRNAMYTLQELLPDPDSRFGESYVYVCNLATDPGRALDKAFMVTGVSDIPFIVDELDPYGTWNGTRQRELEKESREATRIMAESNRIRQGLDRINKGKMPFGKFMHRPISDIPCDYAQYLFKNSEESDDGVLHYLVSRIKALNPEYLLPVITGGYAGDVGKRCEFSVTVIRETFFTTQWGVSNVITMVDNNGAQITSIGSFHREVGTKMRIMAYVKSHDLYEGTEQTLINRVKEL